MSESAPGSAWSVAFRQWRGERRYQEDDFGIAGGKFGGEETAPELLMVLADGMGGEVGGARASRCVVRTFLSRFAELEGATAARLNECLHAANRNLYAQVSDDPELDGMGSTVVAAVYDGCNLSWLSVGDSPMWLFTGGRITRLNADHSMAPVLDRMVESGEISREEALSDGTRQMLRSAVTGLDLDLVDRARRSCRLEQGDCLLVASDGLETLAEEDIERCLGDSNGNAEAAADALFSAVQAAGRPNQDNVTFLLLTDNERTTPGTESDPTATAILPVRAPVVRGRKPMTPFVPRGGVAALLVLAGLVLGIGLARWGPIDLFPPEPSPKSSPEPETTVREPVADDSQVPPATAGGERKTAPTDTAEPPEQSRPQVPASADPAAADAPAPSPAAPVESTTRAQPAAPEDERRGPASEDTRDAAAHAEPPIPASPGPATQDAPPAPVGSATEPPPEAAGATGTRDTVVVEPPGPATHSGPLILEVPGAAAPGARTTPVVPAPATAEPAER